MGENQGQDLVSALLDSKALINDKTYLKIPKNSYVKIQPFVTEQTVFKTSIWHDSRQLPISRSRFLPVLTKGYIGYMKLNVNCFALLRNITQS